MSEVIKIEVNWSEYDPDGAHPAQAMLNSIRAKLTELESEDPEGIKKHLSNEKCTYVYYACGSCSGGRARVDAYCSSNGGSQPDYSWCESC
jgi:hypothetical protein